MTDAPAKPERRRAVALRYDPEEAGAPTVVASGAGLLADRILELARLSGVPVREDRDLVGLLASVPPGREIPEEAYRAVAEILAFLCRVNARAAARK